jgi:MerR family transcriptional regulator, heat shock protein HspR
MTNKRLNKKEMLFSISAVAKMFSVHQQTIRLYEKQGLIRPKRSSGNTRLFSEDDITQLEEIIFLTHQLGINLAGVDMILKLKKQIARMQKDINKMFTQTQEQLDVESLKSKENAAHTFSRLLELKNVQDQKKGASTALSLQSILNLQENQPEDHGQSIKDDTDEE